MPIYSTFMLSYTVAGLGAEIICPSALTFAGGMQPKNFFQHNTIPFIHAPANSQTSTRVNLTYFFSYAGGGTPTVPPTVSLPVTGYTLPDAPGGDLVIIAVPFNIVNQLTALSPDDDFKSFIRL